MTFFLTKYIQGKESPAMAYWAMWSIPLVLLQALYEYLPDIILSNNFLIELQIFILVIMGCIYIYGPLITWRCAKNAHTRWGYNLSKGVSGAAPALSVLRMNAYPMSAVASDLSILVILMAMGYVAVIVFKGKWWKDWDKEKLDYWTLPVWISITSFIAFLASITNMLNI